MKQQIDTGNTNLDLFIETTLQDCQECKSAPAVLLTSQKIPACKKHWLQLADKNISWSSTQQ